MIFVFHLNNKIASVQSRNGKQIEFNPNNSISKGLYELAEKYNDEVLVWCHLECKELLNVNELNSLFHHDKLMLSFQPSVINYFDDKIGYVEDSPFIKIKKEVSYPTWQMSSIVGVIHAKVLLASKDIVPFDVNFDYYLNSLAKLSMPFGLLCYSEPKLFNINMDLVVPKANMFILFRFVKQHYKTRWLFLLFLNLILYERWCHLLPLLYSVFFKKRNHLILDFNSVPVRSSKKVVEKLTIDVLIPTIGRKKYLYDVLKDLSNQTILPKNVIIVEQNPLEDCSSELDYIYTEKWPFSIQHFFIHNVGVCNARNLALSHLKSDWVFFADDDIVLASDFIENAYKIINQSNNEAFTFCCYLKNENQNFKFIKQWETFGAGCSMVKASAIEGVRFDVSFEFGFGEDADFGVQLRNTGVDILYLPEPSILHIKAPIGGFRTNPKLKWHDDHIQPKPSPTVMLYKLKHQTKEQLQGYKTILFFKYYWLQSIKNPISYNSTFKKQWRQSMYWANKLNQKSSQ